MFVQQAKFAKFYFKGMIPLENGSRLFDFSSSKLMMKVNGTRLNNPPPWVLKYFYVIEHPILDVWEVDENGKLARNRPEEKFLENDEIPQSLMPILRRGDVQNIFFNIYECVILLKKQIILYLYYYSIK